MSAAIMMPPTFDAAIRSMCSDAVSQAVAALAAKHGFDAEEALRDVGIGELKLVRKRGPAPKKVAEKSVKKKKPKVDAEGKPVKKALSGYQLFLAEVRPETKVEVLAAMKAEQKKKVAAAEEQLRSLADDCPEEDRKAAEAAVVEAKKTKALQSKDVMKASSPKWWALSVEERLGWGVRAKEAATPEVSSDDGSEQFEIVVPESDAEEELEEIEE